MTLFILTGFGTNVTYVHNTKTHIT